MDGVKVGYLWESYPHKRNIINIVDGANYVKVSDVYKYLSYATFGLKKLRLPKMDGIYTHSKFSFNDFNHNKVDVLHFFNNVSYGKTPWVSTFETFIPRENNIKKGGYFVRNALKALSDDSCKKIIGLSRCTVDFQKDILTLYPEYKNAIEQKMIVIHPPQKLYVKSFEEKRIDVNGEIAFILVGGDFFRKGGSEILTVFNKLKNDLNLPVKLTIVSSMNTNDYATKSNQSDYEKAMSFIEENASWITHYKSLPNSQVLELMKNHHIGLLPTWADTYGYSVLEMQSTGCPTITTDIRALPEINNNEIGWMINVPKNHVGEAFFKTKEMRDELSAIITKELEKVITEIMADRGSIKTKSENALKHIQENHSPEIYATRIREVYTESLLTN